MTLTITTPDVDARRVDKSVTYLAYQNSKIKRYRVKVVFGATDDYATNGVAANLKKFGAKTILNAQLVYSDIGAVAYYDIANGKIKVYGFTPTSATAGSLVLTELSNASQELRSKTLEFMVEAV